MPIKATLRGLGVSRNAIRRPMAANRVWVLWLMFLSSDPASRTPPQVAVGSSKHGTGRMLGAPVQTTWCCGDSPRSR
jgi:hypothetical protein